MRPFVMGLMVALAVGCQPQGKSEPELTKAKSTADEPESSRPIPPEPTPEAPSEFASWPRITETPVPVSTHLWMLCRNLKPCERMQLEALVKKEGPHAQYTIVVRVSPEAEAAFREGKPLPEGASVVKEKYTNADAKGPMHGYALMTKQPAGYFPDGGDWEYVFAESRSTPPTRGQLTECASCHASARESDYLYRSYRAKAK